MIGYMRIIGMINSEMKKVLNKIWIEPFHDLNNRIDTGQPTILIDGKVLANEVHILDKNGDVVAKIIQKNSDEDVESNNYRGPKGRSIWLETEYECLLFVGDKDKKYEISKFDITKDRFANEFDFHVGVKYDIPKDGLFQVKWPNGNLRYEWNYKDGKRADGKSYGWWPNGKQKIIRNWKDGKHYGLQREFYTDGSIWLEENISTGTFVEYSKDGNVIQTGSFNLDYIETGDYGAKLSHPIWDNSWNEDINTTK